MDDREMQDVLEDIETSVLSIVHQVDNEDLVVDDLCFQVESVAREVVLLEALLPEVTDNSLIPLVLEMVSAVQKLVDDHHRSTMKGRHQIVIEEEQISLLLEYHFSVSAIAQVFGVSARTVWRRITAGNYTSFLRSQ